MDGWTDAELAAAVDAYRDMARREAAAQPYNKREVYRALQRAYGRTEKSYEYRMKNISAVLLEMGEEPIPGLKPAGNVGTNVKARLISLLADPGGERVPRTQPSPNGTRSIRRITQTTVYDRDPDVVRKAKQRASDGRCECCGELGFETDVGGYYLEAHHVVPLNCGGPDTVWNVVAICSNDHRRAHFAQNRSAVRDQLVGVLGNYYPDRLGELLGLCRSMDALPDLAEQFELDPNS